MIKLHVTVPYLHDGGVAIGKDALKVDESGYKIVNSKQLGLAGTALNQIVPDPSASLRSLERRLSVSGKVSIVGWV